MRFLFYILLLSLSALTVNAENRGIPFIHNYLATEYNAHNRNFDVACDDYGSVYFANFECLLYYDGSSWRKIHSPQLNRFTRVVWDKHLKRIWVGGYNFFGYLMPDNKGRLQLVTLQSSKRVNDFGEVDKIELHDKDVFVHVLDGRVYKWDGKDHMEPYRGSTTFIDTNMEHVALLYTGNINLAFKYGKGLTVTDGTHKRIIDESDGLCSNNVNFVMFDRNHTVWGATDHGIFAIEMPSPFSHITDGQGLKGDVYCIEQLDETIFVGTLQGLFRIDNGKVTHVPGIDLACWQLTKDGNSLLASTTTGLYRVTPNKVKRIEVDYTYATIPAPQGGYYTSQNDSIYYVPDENDDINYVNLAHIEKSIKLQIAGRKLQVETVNGQLYLVDTKPPYTITCIRKEININAPKLDYTDALGRKWRTDAEGKGLSIFANGNKNINEWAHPLSSFALNAIYCGKENSLWVGGDFGIINCDIGFVSRMNKSVLAEPLYIRQVLLGDSVEWGGYTKNDYKPLTHVRGLVFPSDSHDLKVYFSSRSKSFLGTTQFRYRTNGGGWSSWTDQPFINFHNLQYGDTELDIQATDIFGNVSVAIVSYHVEYPFYMQWWAYAVYIIIMFFIGSAITRYRMNKLKREKQNLENAVKKATAEISEQNEILSLQKEALSMQKEELSLRSEELSQRSDELASTLDTLRKTQADLVRMERTATAGKLTQGLIDRILNPLNYINNFSKLTSGLAKDLREDIEDEKENMSADGYDDCEDILDMMHQNLTKIEEHGVNTTRTLRAMEAMLNTHIGTLRPTDLTALCQQIATVEMENYKSLVQEYHINFTTNIADGITYNIDPETITETLKALLSNAFYAVIKRMKQSAYDNPEVTFSLSLHKEPHICIVIHDNGIGIEATILDKVFDPFFTTKPTGEASGVGLYLAREVIQGHKGSITVASEKETFTDFTIIL